MAEKNIAPYAIACIAVFIPMSTTHTSTRIRRKKSVTGHGLSCVKYYLWLTFISGPKVLLTSQISGKCAFIMTLMCAPSLLFCFMLTVPELIFQSPHQQAYFYFSMVLNEDPCRWIILIVAGICSLMSLAVPVTMRDPNSPITLNGFS